MNVPRRNFLGSFFLASLSYSPLVRNLKRLTDFSTSFATPADFSAFDNQIDQTYIIDLHCHPNMKNYLLGRRKWTHLFHFNLKGSNKYNMQVDMHNLKKGNVLGILAAHHLPERGMVEQANQNRKLLPWIRAVLPLLVKKTENGDESNYRQLTYMMDEFEAHVDKTNQKKGGGRIKIAKSYKEFEEIINSKQIAVAQSIEGIHALGRRIGDDEYIDRLNFVADRGICLITLSHFFDNDISFGVEGIEPHEKKKIQLNWKYDPEYDNRPLTETGKKVVLQMLKRGVIVDITHLTPIARSQVFEINESFFKQSGLRRPIIFTHTGLQKVIDDNNPLLPDFKAYSATDDEVKLIAACDGVIGIIGENFWLVGNDNHTSSSDTRNYKNCIKYIIDTIKAIKEITGDYRNISLGTDFDGFANSPADFRNPGYFPRLVEQIRKELPDCDIEAITHGNALRVLEKGWGNPVV